MLRKIFASPEKFTVHDALPPAWALSDEGAANHTRLCAAHDQPGLHLMVFGFDPFDASLAAPQKFPARQSSAASAAIMRRHRAANYMLIQQTPTAIDAGVFHNDVIAVGNGNVLLYHETAFVNSAEVIGNIDDFFVAQNRRWFPFQFSISELPVDDAVGSYFFNSQIVTRPDGKMTLICPIEVSETNTARACAEKVVQGDGPVDEVQYFDLRQSMNNGGGPACLRLRVVLDEAQAAQVHQNVFLTEELLQALNQWVTQHYRDSLSVDDLRDPNLIDEIHTAFQALSQILNLPANVLIGE